MHPSQAPPSTANTAPPQKHNPTLMGLPVEPRMRIHEHLVPDPWWKTDPPNSHPSSSSSEASHLVSHLRHHATPDPDDDDELRDTDSVRSSDNDAYGPAGNITVFMATCPRIHDEACDFLYGRGRGGIHVLCSLARGRRQKAIFLQSPSGARIPAARRGGAANEDPRVACRAQDLALELAAWLQRWDPRPLTSLDLHLDILTPGLPSPALDSPRRLQAELDAHVPSSHPTARQHVAAFILDPPAESAPGT
ncbi:hypothetical protein LTR53_001988 [Teratosphaeriaceae sp. CCFEE 6253]|nr:hypothetical protein LTR53_001988 [Teratosphaeriaceae sp. CCFEE 6253]